jgi:hypothetical protein
MVGRPKLPKRARKGEILNIRVTASEKAEIAEAARRISAGGASAWVRMLALQAARKINEKAD